MRPAFPIRVALIATLSLAISDCMFAQPDYHFVAQNVTAPFDEATGVGSFDQTLSIVEIAPTRAAAFSSTRRPRLTSSVAVTSTLTATSI